MKIQNPIFLSHLRSQMRNRSLLVVENRRKNRCYEDYDDIVNVATEAWQNFTAEDGRVQSLGARDWAAI